VQRTHITSEASNKVLHARREGSYTPKNIIFSSFGVWRTHITSEASNKVLHARREGSYTPGYTSEEKVLKQTASLGF